MKLSRNDVFWQITCFPGKRYCIGVTLSNSVIPIYIATLIQNFNFSPVPGQVTPSTGKRRVGLEIRRAILILRFLWFCYRARIRSESISEGIFGPGHTQTVKEEGRHNIKEKMVSSKIKKIFVKNAQHE